MGTEKSSWSIVMVGSGVGWGRVGRGQEDSRAGWCAVFFEQGCPQMGRSWPGAASHCTLCFLLWGCLPWPAELRDSTRYDMRVELMVELADALGWAPHRTQKSGASEAIPSNPISFPLTNQQKPKAHTFTKDRTWNKKLKEFKISPLFSESTVRSVRVPHPPPCIL